MKFAPFQMLHVSILELWVQGAVGHCDSCSIFNASMIPLRWLSAKSTNFTMTKNFKTRRPCVVSMDHNSGFKRRRVWKLPAYAFVVSLVIKQNATTTPRHVVRLSVMNVWPVSSLSCWGNRQYARLCWNSWNSFSVLTKNSCRLFHVTNQFNTESVHNSFTTMPHYYVTQNPVVFVPLCYYMYIYIYIYVCMYVCMYEGPAEWSVLHSLPCETKQKSLWCLHWNVSPSF
jgi:hypothetical protein